MEFNKVQDSEANNESLYMSHLKSKMNCDKSNGSGKIIISIEMDQHENVTTISVSTPLSCDCLPDCISEETNDNMPYHVFVHNGLLTTSINFVHNKEGALEDLLQIISSLIAKTTSMKLALEVISNG